MTDAPPSGLTLLILVALGLGCSGGSGGAPGSPYIDFVSGLGGVDTVQTERSQLLVIRVSNLDGAPAVGDVVRFEGVPLNSSGERGVYPSRLDDPFFQPSVVDTADSHGETSVKIKVGIRTGTVRLAVAVPARGISDTARFTVLPGAPVAIRFLPEDTAVYAGNSVQLRSTVVDRFENPRAEPVTHALLSGPATATAGGLVTATAIGAARLKATSGTMADTGGVSVVPVGMLAAVRLVDLGSIVVFNLDGTGYTQSQEVGGGGYDRSPVWSPDGTEIVFANGDYDPMRLSALDLAGNLRRVIPSPPAGVVEEVAPEFSSGGAWIYFTEVGQASGIWRVHPDGSGGERISVGADIRDAHFWASPSPDGTRYSYFTNTGFGLKVFTLADSSISTWIVEGQRSRWSPLGNYIAFTIDRDGTVHLISPAGTGNRVVTPLTVYYDPKSLSWSPDAQWLAVRSPTSLELLNVQTGQRLPLGFTLHFYQPAWRP